MFTVFEASLFYVWRSLTGPDNYVSILLALADYFLELDASPWLPFLDRYLEEWIK